MSLTIGELSESSGVPVVTLRDWDRRHGLSPSHRTIGNHRRYTDDDAVLVVRVRDLVASGLRLRAAIPLAIAAHHAAADQAAARQLTAPKAPANAVAAPPVTAHSVAAQHSLADQTAAAVAAVEQQRIREALALARGVTLARRDELVAERQALVARRESLVRERSAFHPVEAENRGTP